MKSTTQQQRWEKNKTVNIHRQLTDNNGITNNSYTEPQHTTKTNTKQTTIGNNTEQQQT